MIVWIVATLVAYFVKGLCGFASTMVFTSVLSFSNNNIDISPIDLLLSYFTNAAIAWRERKYILWKVCLPLAGLMLAGSVPGLFFLKNTNASVIKIGFGAVVIYLGVDMLLKEFKPRKTRDSKVFITIVGIISGVMYGMYGIGALLSAYITRKTDSALSFKANICTLFLIADTCRVVLYAATGIITLASIQRTLLLVPFMALGVFLGMKSSSVLNDKTAKRIVIIMLIVSGVALILNNL